MVALGSAWTGPILEESSANVGIPTRNAKDCTKWIALVQELSANVGASTELGR
ncbi:hypothetical protein PILCRDRAFT_812029 [Piloderma croceum F 1598]|uniref:Uncharacterized protein n=1 Tax=Piloderma croceum (strain F 1598) TaxID=765440 RepID=A0A0C3CKT5_PILCF|nr:hypothetical protein PILCRDRAFT_812029 [Piloderma croceum F 1598]